MDGERTGSVGAGAYRQMALKPKPRATNVSPELLAAAKAGRLAFWAEWDRVVQLVAEENRQAANARRLAQHSPGSSTAST